MQHTELNILINDNNLIKLATFCDSYLNLKDAKLPKEYYYQSLPLCLIDAVFSIGIKYQTVQKVVERYCQFFAYKKFRDNVDLPSTEEQESISNFLSKQGKYDFTQVIFQNRNRTSPKNGILKTDAVFEFAMVLKKYKIEYFQDINNIYGNNNLITDIKNIPGQKSGISLKYFLMLAGDDNMIKPDRQIIAFLESVLKQKVGLNEAQVILEKCCTLLRTKYQHLTPRLLDYQIWLYQREL